MTVPMMIYGMALALLVAAAAHFLDRSLRSLVRPTRWVWLGAMVVAGLAPFIPRLVDASAPDALAEGFAHPVELLYEVGSVDASITVGSKVFHPPVEASLGVLWIVAAAIVLLVFAAGWLRLRRQSRQWESSRVSGEDVLLSDALGPAVMGLIRPRIVLPRWVLALPEQDLELVMVHEKEHREARDPTILAAGLLLTALSPWNPVIWWALKRLRLAVDGDCDARVLAGGISPKYYAGLLIDVAARSEKSPALVPALAAGANTNLEQRLIMLRSKMRKHRAWSAALAAASGLALLAIACETPLPQETAGLDFSATEAERLPTIRVPTTHSRLAAALEAGWIADHQIDGIREHIAIAVGDADLAADGLTEEVAFGVYLSQELEAFETALRERVNGGELTEDQARTAHDGYSTLIARAREALARGIEEQEATLARREQLARFRAEVERAIATGEITESEGRARLEEFMARVEGGR